MNIFSSFLGRGSALGILVLLSVGLVSCKSEDMTTTVEETTGPKTISTPRELSEIRNESDGEYILVNDITMPPVTGVVGCAPELEESIPDYCTAGWSPISEFAGSIDGNGFIIKNLTINRQNESSSDGVSRMGLFAYINDGAVATNLKLEDVGIKVAYDGSVELAVGAIAGWNWGTITNSYATGNIYSQSTDGNIFAGGLVGSNLGYRGKISSSYASVDILAEGGSMPSAGGIAGFNGGDESIIENSYATGNMSAGSIAGGIVAYAYGAIVSNTYSTGNLSASSYVGRIAAFNYGYVYLTNYGDSAATMIGPEIYQTGITVPAGTTLRGGTWSDTTIWKSNIAFPKLAWEK